MRALSIILLCCLAFFVIGVLQGMTCEQKDNKPTACTQTWGSVACVICLMTIYYLYKKK